jgi:hypothetical protein
LPDGIFSNQKSTFGYFWEGLGIANVGVFCGHLGYLQPFGMFHSHMVHFVVNWQIFPRFGKLYLPRKIWQPCFGFGMEQNELYSGLKTLTD